LQSGLLKIKQMLYFIFTFGNLYSEGLDFLICPNHSEVTTTMFSKTSLFPGLKIKAVFIAFQEFS